MKMQSKTTGNVINRRIYIAIVVFMMTLPLMLCIPTYLLTYLSSNTSIGIYELFFAAAFALLSTWLLSKVTNKIYFGISKSSLFMLSALGTIQQQLKIEDIAMIAIVGAASQGSAVGSNKRIGYYDNDRNFIYHPYILIYNRQEPLVFKGNDMRDYDGYKLGFVLVNKNIDVFTQILDSYQGKVYIARNIVDLDKLGCLRHLDNTCPL